jgi:hypothetical protein
MARLFIGPREQQFMADITKEYVKDIVGQFIIYFPVSVLHTQIHPVYDEAVEKIFENPIKLDILAEQPERSNRWDQFGTEGDTTLEVYVQPRDLIDKGLQITGGDYFLYGEEVYEIIGVVDVENIYGQVEYERGKKITGNLSRIGGFDIDSFKDLLAASKDFSESAVQKKFVQQRGLSENEEGNTSDVREIRKRLGEGMAEVALGEGPRKVDIDREDEEGDTPLDIATEPEGSGFYNE